MNIIAIATTASGPRLLTGQQNNGIAESSLKNTNLEGQVRYSLNVPADTTMINVTVSIQVTFCFFPMYVNYAFKHLWFDCNFTL